MKFSGKMCFKIILKVTKKQGSTLSLEDTFFKKPQEVGQFDPTPPTPSPGRFRLIYDIYNKYYLFYNTYHKILY